MGNNTRDAKGLGVERYPFGREWRLVCRKTRWVSEAIEPVMLRRVRLGGLGDAKPPPRPARSSAPGGCFRPISGCLESLDHHLDHFFSTISLLLLSRWY